MVFDKTGTLTTGALTVSDYRIAEGHDPALVGRLIFDLEGLQLPPHRLLRP